MRIRSCKFLIFILLISSNPITYSQAEEVRNAEKLAIASEVITKNPDVFYVTKKTKSRDLKKLPETTPIALPNGTVLSTADFNRLSRIGEALRKHKKKDLPKGLTQKPKKRGISINNSEDLKKALKRKDKETLVLPSGEHMTVGLLKLLEPQIERQLGRSLTETGDHAKTVKVGKKTDWKSVLQMPDDTILQAPNGTKITVIQLKASLAKKMKGHNALKREKR